MIGDFINGSTARAIHVLAIFYSESGGDHDVYYVFSLLPTKEEKIMATVGGIPPGMYNISVFIVENNGLPFNRSATTPRNVSVTDGGHGKLSVGNSHNLCL